MNDKIVELPLSQIVPGDNDRQDAGKSTRQRGPLFGRPTGPASGNPPLYLS